MKSMRKKFLSLFTAAAAIVTLSFGASSMAYAEEMDETLKSYVQESTKLLGDQLIEMTDEDIESLKQVDDTFTVNAATSWESAKAEVGERVNALDSESAETSDSVKVEIKDDSYIGTYEVDFTEFDASFVVTFDQNGTPTDLSVNVEVPMSVNLQRAGLNTLMGVGTVFLVLVFLSFLISCFKYIPNPEQKKAEEAKKAAAEKAAAPVPVAAVEEDYADDEELVAVIMAAIAASEGTSTDGFVVRSIRKARRAR